MNENPIHQHSALNKTAVNSAQWKASATIIISVLALVQLFILTKFLPASVFGVIAIGRVILGFLMHLSDSGMKNAILVNQSLSDRLFSTVFWINLSFVTSLSLAVYLLIPWISLLYEMSSLQFILYIFIIAFIAHGFGSFYKVILQKNLKIKILSIIEMSAMFVSVILTIYLAIKNPVASALAFGILVNIIISSIGYIFYGFHIHPLKLQFQKSGLKYFFSFGAYQLGERILNYFHNKIDVLIIGKLLGSEILGVYDIFKQLLNRPESLINPVLDFVALPIMAKKQSTIQSIAKIYLRMMSYSATLLFPIYSVLIILAHPFVLYFFGSEWIEYVYLFQLIAAYFIIHSTLNHIGTLWVAVSNPSYGFYWNIVVIMIFPIAIFIASHYSIHLVIITMRVSSLILFYPMYLFIVEKLVPITWGQYINSIILPFWISIVTFIPLLILSYFTNNLILLCTGIIIYTLVVLWLNKKYNHQIYIELKSLAFFTTIKGINKL